MSIHNTVITRCLAVAVCTRNLNYNADEYQKGVIEPYEKMQKLQYQIEKQGILPSREQNEEALKLLKTIFATKNVPVEIQNKRFIKILEETGTKEDFYEQLS